MQHRKVGTKDSTGEDRRHTAKGGSPAPASRTSARGAARAAPTRPAPPRLPAPCCRHRAEPTPLRARPATGKKSRGEKKKKKKEVQLAAPSGQVTDRVPHADLAPGAALRGARPLLVPAGLRALRGSGAASRPRGRARSPRAPPRSATGSTGGDRCRARHSLSPATHPRKLPRWRPTAHPPRCSAALRARDELTPPPAPLRSAPPAAALARGPAPPPARRRGGAGASSPRAFP